MAAGCTLLVHGTNEHDRHAAHLARPTLISSDKRGF